MPPVPRMTRAQRLALLPDLLARRILVLDGAMGTMLQRHRLGEADYRGERFANRRATSRATTTSSPSRSATS